MGSQVFDVAADVLLIFEDDSVVDYTMEELRVQRVE